MKENKYDFKPEELRKVIDKISELSESKKINYTAIYDEFKITKDQYYFSLYNYLLETGYLNSEPDEELLIKISSSDKFKDINLPFDERREFLNFIILHANKVFSTTFKDQILKISNSQYHLGYFQIQHEFSKALPQLKISKEDLIQILNHFAKCAENDMTVGEVYTACREYCSKNPDEGWKLLDFMLEKKEVNFLSQALMGLSTSDFKKTIEVIEKLIESEFKPQALFALGYLDYNKKEENLKYILGLFEKAIEDPDQAVRLAIVKALTNMLNMPFVIEYKAEKKILELIKVLLKEKEPNSLYSVLTGMSIFSRQHGHDFLQDILEYYYDVDLKYKGIIRDLGFRLSEIKSPEVVFNFLHNWIKNHEEIEYIKEFGYSLRELYKKNPEKYIEIYLRKIIDNKANIRKVFKTEFEISDLNDNNRNLWIEKIGELSDNEKIKLFISLTDHTIDVKKRLEIAFLVLKYLNQNIYKVILQEAVWLIHDYSSIIKEVIEKTVDLSDMLQKKFLEEFDKNYNIILKFWEEKSKINELNPKLNQTKYLNKFNEIFLKKQSEYVTNFKSEDTPILNMFKNIQIGRGSGFKISEKDAPVQMQEFRMSYVLPRTMFIYPEAYNYNYNKKHNEDWE